MNKIIKDACILFAITLVAGIVLGAVYNITKGPIAEQNEVKGQEVKGIGSAAKHALTGAVCRVGFIGYLVNLFLTA